MTTKINCKEPEIFEIKKIAKEVENKIERYTKFELNDKIKEVTIILNLLKDKKRSINKENIYKMKTLEV